MHLLGMDTIDCDLPPKPFLCKEDMYSYIHSVAQDILDKYVKVTEGKRLVRILEAGTFTNLTYIGLYMYRQ